MKRHPATALVVVIGAMLATPAAARPAKAWPDDRSKWSPAQWAEFNLAQAEASAKIARAKEILEHGSLEDLGIEVPHPPQPTSRVWRVDASDPYSPTCAEGPLGRSVLTIGVRSSARYDRPSATAWRSFGCERSRPRWLTQRQVVERMNAQLRAMQTPLRGEDILAEARALAARNPPPSGR